MPTDAVIAQQASVEPATVFGNDRSVDGLVPAISKTASKESVDMPPLEALRVFVVAAQHLSFSKAAGELHVTQSAVSHRILNLEKHLETRLFHRARKSLQLTQAGLNLAQGLQRGMAEIREAVRGLDSRGRRATLNISVPSAFGSRWLIPRLAKFRKQFPKIELSVQAEERTADLRSYGTDVAICFSRGGYPGLVGLEFLPEGMVPVCSPRVAARHKPVERAADILKFPLLHMHAEPDESGADWSAWLRQVGGPAIENASLSGPRFNDPRLVIDAAMSDMGVALARNSLLDSELHSGRLVCPFPRVVPARFSYYLVMLPERASDYKLRAFRDWVFEEAKKPAFHFAQPESLSESPPIRILCGERANFAHR